MLLVRGGEVLAPEPLGRQDLLLAGGSVVHLAPSIPVPRDLGDIEVVDATGHLVVPGFVDGHVHLLGGGGEGGFATRTPPITFTDLSMAGITTAVGLLGTDDVTRSLEALLATARALTEEGLSAYVLTGSYRVPATTLTGDVTGDLVLIPEIVGTGEVAVADHRGSQPTLEEFARLAAATRRGGLLSGKAGAVTVHLGDGEEELDLLEAVVTRTPLPRRVLLPTHVGRNPGLFESAQRWALAGGRVDLTTSTTPEILEQGEVKASRGLVALLEAGVPIERITFSSDGQGSLPVFDAEGSYQGLQVGSVASLFSEVRDAVLDEGVPLERVLPVVTSNVARFHGLRGKGRIAVGADADLVLLDDTELSVATVVASGQVLVRDRLPIIAGTFERPPET
jgi:beta-aspartyl-dipeptidase (metallo-type)